MNYLALTGFALALGSVDLIGTLLGLVILVVSVPYLIEEIEQ